MEAYWNEEHAEIKYQIGEGSGVDQVLAQWHANLYGLGELFDAEQTRQALKSEYEMNFRANMRDIYNPCRVYCLNDEAGLIICVWPDNVYKPVIPLPYSQETQNGYEYASACHMAHNGLIDEAVSVISAIRDRYDGKKRNPWNEIECGNNYARSMASFSLLQTFAGFKYDMVRREIGFDPPVPHDGPFRCFWSLDCAWGEFETTAGYDEIRVLRGKLILSKLSSPGTASQMRTEVVLDRRSIPVERRENSIIFPAPMIIESQQALRVAYKLD